MPELLLWEVQRRLRGWTVDAIHGRFHERERREGGREEREIQ